MMSGHDPRSYDPSWWDEQHQATDSDHLIWIEAAYTGRCRGCGERWEPGDMIAFDADQQGYIGTCCGAAEGDDLYGC